MHRTNEQLHDIIVRCAERAMRQLRYAAQDPANADYYRGIASRASELAIHCALQLRAGVQS